MTAFSARPMPIPDTGARTRIDAAVLWVALFVAAGLNVVVALIYPSVIDLVGAVVLCVAAIVLSFRTNRFAAALLIPIFMYKLSNYVSFTAISMGIYLPELGIAGDMSIAPSSYLPTALLFFATVHLALRPLLRSGLVPSPSREHAGDGHTLLTYLIVGAYVVYQSLVLIRQGLTTGFPILNGDDRFVYRATYAIDDYIVILNSKPIAALMVAMVLTMTQIGRQAKLALVAAYLALVVLYVLFAEKFFQIFLLISFFLVPLAVSDYGRRLGRQFIALLPLIVVAVALAFSVVYYIYSDQGRLSSFETAEKIFGRVASQAQLWFIAVEDDVPFFTVDTTYFRSVLETMLSSDPNRDVIFKNVGSFYFVTRFSPTEIFNSIASMSGAVQFTQVYEAAFLETSGIAGLAIAMVLAGLVWTGIMAMILRAIVLRSAIRLFVWGRVISNVLAVLNQGLISHMFGVIYVRGTIIAILVELAMLVVSHRRTRRRRWKTANRPMAPRPAWRQA